MIINFSVQNFGSIKDQQTLSFEADNSDHLENAYVVEVGGLRLLKLALIYGANASGKTTLLKALDFIREVVLHPLSKKTEELEFEPYLFDSYTPSQPSLISIEFIQNEVRYTYELEFIKSAILREELNFYKPKKANLFKRKTQLESQFSELTFGGKVKIEKSIEKALAANTLWNNTVFGGFLKTNIEFPELNEVVDWFRRNLKPVVYPNSDLSKFVTKRIKENQVLKVDVLKVLKKADFRISDLSISEEVQEIPEVLVELLKKDAVKNGESESTFSSQYTALKLVMEHSLNNTSYKLPFESESSGTKRYYGFAGLLAMLLRSNSIIPIDELETSLHPDLVHHFLLSFIMNDSQSQLIATTHHREILNNKDVFRNDIVWFTNMTSECTTELYSLADFGSDVVRNSTNILNAYKAGNLGGIPKPGDYFIEFD